MIILLRVLSGLVALLFMRQGLQWVFSPGEVANSLGMPLLEGVGASTQIGDLGSFFLVSGCMMIVGQLPGRSFWLYPPACFVLGAAFMRSIAALTQNADWAIQFIVIEVLMSSILFLTAQKLSSRG
ncbi:MAG: hypothetical protein CL917_09055 [Deltaproteobacteria bacterium]|nr:hypothetical protein [Deltaproteobacteria bacterium]